MSNFGASQIWEATLGRLQLQVTRPSYETWLKNTVGLSYGADELVVGIPNPFALEMLEKRMYSLISQAVSQVTNSPIQIRFESLVKQDNILQDKSNNSQISVKGSVEVESESRVLKSPVLSRQNGHRLNNKYKFDCFIEGPNNQLAFAAAKAVADRPGTIYNPLFIYSPVGLGKTHLLHSIGHEANAKGLSSIYVSSEQFTNEFVMAVRGGKAHEFRDKYRSVDVLLLDDIQFLVGKEQTIEGFFHTFNALHMENKQIVVASDRPPQALFRLQDRICSRFNGGLIVDIQPPKIEVREAILLMKADLHEQNIPHDVIRFLAQNILKNVRELEGALNRVLAYGHLTGAKITTEMAKRVIADLIECQNREAIPVDMIIQQISSHLGVTLDDLKGRRRNPKITRARQILMYLLKEDGGCSVTEIGTLLGGRDRTTAIYAFNRITSRLDVDSLLRDDIHAIRQLGSSR